MPRPENVFVSFRNVRKTYDGDHLIVKDLNLDICSGEFLTLLGPSGSGKTTCLMMLAGFEHPTEGEIRLDGRLLNRIPPHKRNIGMVFQNYALFPHMSVEQNIEYPLRVRGVSASDSSKKVKKALGMVQMGAFGKRYPAQLSGGQQQRVAIARALVFDPKLVLMDEPLGALDKQLRERMQIELKELHRSLGVTFVYVTHDQSEALTMSDRVAVFDRGVIQQIDTVDTLYEAPRNIFVANFIGDSNNLRGQVLGIDDQYCDIRLGDGGLLRGINAGGVPRVGSDVTAVIRPERLSLSTAANIDGLTVSANAIDLVYFGDHVRLHCRVSGVNDCFVKVPLGHPGLEDVQAGKPIRLAYHFNHVRIFH
ncbi:MAG: ABC transporter ATP-binding protein [Burkholderiaceae bacterium]